MTRYKISLKSSSENNKNTNIRITSNADVYIFGDPYGYLVADFIAFCQTTKKPVKLDEYKLCRLFYVVSNFLTVG